MESVLVTGGGGFLGFYTVKKHVERGDKVRVMGRGTYPELEKLGVEVIRGDIRNIEDVERASRGVELIQHVAAIPGIWGKKEDFYSINYNGTLNIIAICRKLGIDRLIYTSSPSVIHRKEPISGLSENELDYPIGYNAHYPASKAMAEREVLKANGTPIEGGKILKTIALRPHLIWGPGDKNLIPRIIKKGRAGKLRIIGDGENRVDVVYIENAAMAQLIAADRLKDRWETVGGKPYFITQQEPVKLWEFMNRILELSGVPPIVGKIPFSIAYLVGWAFEVAYGIMGRYDEPPMTRFLAEQLGHDHYFNPKLAREELGYMAEISTEEGLKRLGEYIADKM